MFRFALNSLLVILAALVQISAGAMIAGVRPNLALVALLSIGVFESRWSRRIFFLLFAALILKFYPYWDPGVLIFFTSALVGIGLIDYLPWRNMINWFAAVLVSTVLATGLEFYWGIIEVEIFYNYLFGLIFVLAAWKINENK